MKGIKAVNDKLRARIKECDNNKGFTLVELLVAMVILALVVVPTLQVFVTATKTNSKARIELQANITANSVLESAKSFSIYVFDKQCNEADSSTFSLVAGQMTDDGTVKTLLQAGGSCGKVQFNADGSVDRITTGNTFQKEQSTYAYAINGIKQSNSTYDAVIVYKLRNEGQTVGITSTSGGSLSSYDQNFVESVLPNYNKEYDITVYVYKHNKSGDFAYIGKNLETDSGALVTITGSKVDTAMAPTS